MKNKIILILMAIATAVTMAGCNIIRAETPDETDAAETTAEITETTETTITEPTVSEEPAQTTTTKEDGEHIDYIMGDVDITGNAEDVFEKLIADNVIGEEVYMLGWTADVVSDGIHSTKDGLIELYHIEGVLDISLPFADILNQKEAQEQIDTLVAIADAYKNAFNVDIVRITCNGESVITDEISYDEIVQEEIDKLIPAEEDVEADEAYEEEE